MSDEIDLSDEFYFSDEEMMKPLIGFTMKDNPKPPDLNEKSNLVLKKLNTIKEITSQPLELTDIVGKNGWWQIKIMILTMIAGLPTAWNHLGMGFLAFPVDHWCAQPTHVNISLETWQEEFLPNITLKGVIQHSQCEMNLFNKTTGSAEKSKIVSCDSYEYASDFNSIVNKWDLVCDKEWMISTSQTVYMIGFLVAVLFSGHFADVYGRHPALMINIVILIVAGFAAAFSNSFIMFTACRFFVAIGHGGVGLVTYILLIEAVDSKFRVRYVYLQGVGWHCGYMILPLLAWLQPDWFKLQILITAPSIIFLSYFWVKKIIQ